jgi:predicted dehydrogenase
MRVAVIGAKGSAGQRHCAAFQAEGCEVVEVVEGGRLDISLFDAISIATPDHLHYGPLMDALLWDKSVFCEKPLTHDAPKLDYLVGVVDRFNRTFSCNFPLRHSAKIPTFRPVWGQYVWGRPAKWGGWRGDIENYSIIAGGGIHIIDLMMHRIMREPVAAFGANRVGRKMYASLVWPDHWFDLWLDFESSGDHRTTLASTDGIVEFDEPNDFRAPIHEFLEDVKAGRPGNGLEAIAANRVCLQIEEAAK